MGKQFGRQFRGRIPWKGSGSSMLEGATAWCGSYREARSDVVPHLIGW